MSHKNKTYSALLKKYRRYRDEWREMMHYGAELEEEQERVFCEATEMGLTDEEAECLVDELFF